MDKDLAISLTDEEWEKSIIPELVEYIRVPNKSPAFDPDWQSNGFMEQVVDQFVAWSQHQNIEGMELDVIRLPKRTPLIFIDIPGDTENTVLLYGHLDKQPEMTGWDPDKGPWKPVLIENSFNLLYLVERLSLTNSNSVSYFSTILSLVVIIMFSLLWFALTVQLYEPVIKVLPSTIQNTRSELWMKILTQMRI